MVRLWSRWHCIVDNAFPLDAPTRWSIVSWLDSNIINIADGDSAPSWTMLIEIPTMTATIIILYKTLIAAATATYHTMVNVSVV